MDADRAGSRAEVRSKAEADRVAATERLVPRLTGSAALGRVAGLAARLLGAGSAQVSLIGEEQHVAGGAGLAPGVVGSTGPASESLCSLVVASGAALVIQDTAGDPRVAGMGPVQCGAVGSYLGMPLVDVGGRVVGALCVFDESARTWSDGDVSVLGELAAAATTELELGALSSDYDTVLLRLGVAMDAARIGSFDLDLVTGELTWDDRLKELFGYDPHEFPGTLDGFFDRLHPDDVPHVRRDVEAAVATAGVLDTQYRVVLPDGTVRWVVGRGRCLLDAQGAPVHLVGAADDRTHERDTATRVTRVLESMPSAFYSLDHEWRFTYVNARGSDLLGMAREELVGANVWELFPGALGSRFETAYRTASATGEQVEFEEYYPPPLDAWYDVQVWPSRDGLSVYFHDVSDRHRALEGAEQAARRIDLLGQVSAQLAAQRDSREALQLLAQLTVPALGDWCLVDALDSSGQVRDAAAWHADDTLRTITAELAAAERNRPVAGGKYALEAVRSGAPVLLPTPAVPFLAASAAPGRFRDMLTGLCGDGTGEHGVVLPLIARGRALGLLTLFRSAERGPLGDFDTETARDVADRAALSLDNVRLYREQRQFAETLQRSMLTEPPRPESAEVVVRYVPAATEAEVGGDWYDGFCQQDGALVVAIGDVTGHDMESAAAMGQVRGLLRGIAYTTGEGPSAVMTRLDQALAGLQVDTSASAIVLRLEPPEDGIERGVLVRWSNAGHPPPMLVEPDGTVSVMGGHRPDLLLGISPEFERAEASMQVAAGSTVLLYTDGLVERRGSSFGDGMERLRQTLAEVVDPAAGALGLDELCDLLLSRLLPAAPGDDVALVAVRVLTPDEASAGS